MRRHDRRVRPRTRGSIAAAPRRSVRSGLMACGMPTHSHNSSAGATMSWPRHSGSIQDSSNPQCAPCTRARARMQSLGHSEETNGEHDGDLPFLDYLSYATSTHMSVRMSIHVPILMRVRVFICMSVHGSLHISIHMSVHMSVRMSVHMSVHMSIHMSVHGCACCSPSRTACLYRRRRTCLYTCLYTCVCVFL